MSRPLLVRVARLDSRDSSKVSIRGEPQQRTTTRMSRLCAGGARGVPLTLTLKATILLGF